MSHEAGFRARCWWSATPAGRAVRRCGRSSACWSIRASREDRSGFLALADVDRILMAVVDPGALAKLGIGALRHRASPGVQGGYVSNGCPQCDALIGRFRVDDLLGDHRAAGRALAELAVTSPSTCSPTHVWRGTVAHAIGLAGAQCDALVRPAPGGAAGMRRVGHLLPARVVGLPARGGGAHAPHVRAAVAGDPARGVARPARQPALGAVPRQRSRRRAALHGALLPPRGRAPRRDLRRGAGGAAGGRVVAGPSRPPAARGRRRGRAGRRPRRALRPRLRGARRRRPPGRAAAGARHAPLRPLGAGGLRPREPARARRSARRWCAPTRRCWPPCTGAERSSPATSGRI